MKSLLNKNTPQLLLAGLRAKLEQSPLAHRLARGAAWSLIGAVSTRALTLVSTAIIVRLLGKEAFGEFGMVQSTLLMLGTFAGMGLGLTATKHTAEFRSADPVRVGRLLGLLLTTGIVGGLGGALIGWLSSDWLAEHVLNRPALAPYLRMTAILVAVGAIDGIFFAALQGFEAFRRVAQRSIYVALVSPFFTVPLVYAFGLRGAVLGLVIATILQMVVDGLGLWRECVRHGVVVTLGSSCWQEWRVLVHFALPALAANVLVMPATWLANVILVNSSSGYAGLGVVNVVTTFRTLVLYLPTVMLAPTLAVLSNEITNPATVRNTLRYALGISALSVLPLALAITCVGKFVLGMFYGSEFASEGRMLACVMFVAAVQATGSGLGCYVSASGRMWLALGINVLFGVAFIALAYVMIPLYGPIGYPGAMALAYLLTVVITYGGFYIAFPRIMNCYPLIQSLALFAVLMVVAVYVNEKFAFVASVSTGGLLALVMGIYLAVPVIRSSSLARSLLVRTKTPSIPGEI